MLLIASPVRTPEAHIPAPDHGVRRTLPLTSLASQADPAAAAEKIGAKIKDSAEAAAEKSKHAADTVIDAAARQIPAPVKQSFRSDPQTWLALGGSAVVLIALVFLGVIGPKAGGPRRDVTGQGWAIWLACCLFVLIGGAIVGGVIGAAISHAPAFAQASDPADYKGDAIVMVCGAVVGITVGIFLLKLTASGSPNAGLSVKPSDAGFGLLAFVLCLCPVAAANLGAVALYEWRTHETPDSTGHKLLTAFKDHPGDPWIWTMLVGAVLLTPILEEIIYRAFLQSSILKLTGRIWPSVLLTSVIFTAMHTAAVPWYALPGLFVFGCALGVAYERTARLGVPMLMHMLFNLVNIVIVARG